MNTLKCQQFKKLIVRIKIYIFKSIKSIIFYSAQKNGAGTKERCTEMFKSPNIVEEIALLMHIGVIFSENLLQKITLNHIGLLFYFHLNHTVERFAKNACNKILCNDEIFKITGNTGPRFMTMMPSLRHPTLSGLSRLFKTLLLSIFY